jgi:hypothetical protein
MLASLFLLWLGGNNWIEATVRGAAIVMAVSAVAGGIATKKDGYDNALSWFFELIPAAIVVLFAADVGGDIGGRQDHMRVMGPYLGIILAAPIAGSAIRAILSSKV